MAPSYASPKPSNPSFRSGARPSIYRPPHTPSATSSSYQSRSDHDRTPTAATSSRKRARCDDPTDGKDNLSRASTRTDSWATTNSSVTDQRAKSTSSVRSASPPPFVNTKYRLAGGIDTPTLAASAQLDSLNAHSEDDFRRTWSSPKVKREHGVQAVAVGALERERNGGRKRRRSSAEDAARNESWSRYVFNMVGGLAGKVWDFCRSTTFHGFAAGPGAAYAMSPATSRQDDAARGWVQIDADDIRRRARDSTPIPGRFPEDDEDDVFGEPEEDARPAKRQQVSHGGDWVVVDRQSLSATENRASRARVSPAQRSLLPRPVGARSASSKHARPSTARLSGATHAGSPQAQHTRSASAASVRSPPASKAPPQQQTSPASADIQKYTAKRQREERLQDASMRKLNQQLKAMIKEGKQALATKVEVEDDIMMGDMVEDEGFAEGDFEVDWKK